MKSLFVAPSPVTRLWTNSQGGELWVKNDGALAAPYGGNKVRKLAHVLPHAVELGRTRILTFGAAGSHHALATAVYAKRFGLKAAAILTPQHWSQHAELTLRAALVQGLEIFPAANSVEALELLPQVYNPCDLLVGPGALGPLGCRGFAEAVAELTAQVHSGVLPQPTCIVVAAGSGSTAAGLLAGLVQRRLDTRVVAVAAATNPALRPQILTQAWFALSSETRRATTMRKLSQSLEIIVNKSGAGYGRPTEEKALARRIAQDFGLKLDVTYTAQAFHQALKEAGHPDLNAAARAEPVLYWHTLSAAEMTPLLEGAPAAPDPSWLSHLLISGSTADDCAPGSEARW
ncbi:MAG TPA: pyridoxal-phosphate dependent enzyme [Polyangiaceae bacterium]|nr:pyridoxal-phosphate dependent enzyme [Polyangiaceae bacterium]